MRFVNTMEEIWLEAQSNIEKVLTPQTFNTWIRPIKFLSSSNYMIELGVPNKFIQEWVVEKYMVMIQEAVSSITDAKYHIQFRISESAEQRKSDGASVITKSENIQTETEKHRHSDFVSNLNPNTPSITSSAVQATSLPMQPRNLLPIIRQQATIPSLFMVVSVWAKPTC